MNVYLWIGSMVLVMGLIGWLEIKFYKQDKASIQYFARTSDEDTKTWGLKFNLGENEDVDTDNPIFLGKLHKHISFLEEKVENHIVFKEGIDIPTYIKQFFSIDTAFGYKHRRKRDSSNLYRVDSLLIVDFSLFERWRDIIINYISSSSVGNDVVLELIRNFYTFLIDRVNRRFSQLDDSDMLLRISVKDIYIAYSIERCPWNTTTMFTSSSSTPSISARTAHEELFSWLKEGNSVSIRDYSLVLGLTAMTLLDDKNQTLQGFSQLGTVCQEPNIVIVQDTFDFIIGTVASHHIAHSLGANEDGKENNCSAHDQFIMSTPSEARTGQTKNNPWIFSECTGREIREYLFALPNICLPKLANSTVIPAYTGTLPGSRLTADRQCQIIQGKKSYMCRVPLGGRYEEICTGMYCFIPVTGSCQLVVPQEGTSCANGKWCINGACVSSSRAPLASDRCVHGDQPVVDFSPAGCPPSIAISNAECYHRAVSLACCQSCLAVSSNTEGCEYGDRENCSIIEARSCYSDQVFRKCCETCPSYGTGIKDCLYGNRIASCALISARDCYVKNDNMECCQTCLSYKRDDPQCPYGDAVSGCHVNECSSYTEDQLVQCCDTCDVRKTTQTQTYTRSSVSRDYVTITNATSTATSKEDWVGPVAGASAGLLSIAIIVAACTVYYRHCRKRCCNVPLEETKAYDHQKLDPNVTERPPIPPPRDVQGLDLSSKGDIEDTYEYIHTNDIEDIPEIASSTGGSDSSGGYMEYSTKGNAHEYLDLVRTESNLVLPKNIGVAGTRGVEKDRSSRNSDHTRL
ncbi:hypothetical protein CHS0354_000399 [Potamilus streckersoni]|uniref:Peptidase M12B domain-containing protein n=1 Tax=Potamilus streckersoni TaxID=2493646 RepID=A0AAE0SMB0_9BIVA|nr:hypothetical protein CHS0354_000399 [Potamilus streckersoni]